MWMEKSCINWMMLRFYDVDRPSETRAYMLVDYSSSLTAGLMMCAEIQRTGTSRLDRQPPRPWTSARQRVTRPDMADFASSAG